MMIDLEKCMMIKKLSKNGLAGQLQDVFGVGWCLESF